MEVIDSQVHANQRGIDQSIAIMDAVGVDAAVIDIWPPVRTKLPNGVNRFEYAFGEEAVARFPPASPTSRALTLTTRKSTS